MFNFKVILFALCCVHIMEGHVVQRDSLEESTDDSVEMLLEKMEENIKESSKIDKTTIGIEGEGVTTENFMAITQMLDAHKSRRYTNDGSLLTTPFAIDYCRRIASCFQCVQEKCVFSGSDDTGYFCRHPLDGHTQNEPWVTLTKIDECAHLSTRLYSGLKLNVLEPEEINDMTYFELPALILIVLIFLTLIGVVGGMAYVKRTITVATTCDLEGQLLSSVQGQDSILVEKVKPIGMK